MNFPKMLFAQVNDDYWKWPEIVHFYWIVCCNTRNQRIHHQKVKTRNRLRTMCAPRIRKSESHKSFTLLLCWMVQINVDNFQCRRKADAMNTSHGKGINPPKRKKQSTKKAANTQAAANKNNTFSDGHMTAEEVERHLQSRQSLIGLVPEAPATVPNEMFSNEPSLDRWRICFSADWLFGGNK